MNNSLKELIALVLGYDRNEPTGAAPPEDLLKGIAVQIAVEEGLCSDPDIRKTLEYFALSGSSYLCQLSSLALEGKLKLDCWGDNMETSQIETSLDEKTGSPKAMYWRIQEGVVARTEELKEGLIFVDYDAKGLILGIELLGLQENKRTGDNISTSKN